MEDTMNRVDQVKALQSEIVKKDEERRLQIGWVYGDKILDQLRHEYKKTVDELVKLTSGVDGFFCDPWLFDSYSDLYKDETGFRPRGGTHQEMKDFCDKRSQKGDRQEGIYTNFSSDLFSWDKKMMTFTSEASAMQIVGGQKKVVLVSSKTGVVKEFILSGMDMDAEGEVQGWWYSCERFKMLVIND